MKSKELITYVLVIGLLCLLFKRNVYEGVDGYGRSEQSPICIPTLAFIAILLGSMGLAAYWSIAEDVF